MKFAGNIISLADERLKVHKTEYDRAGRVLKLRNNQYQYDECGRLIEKTETKKGFRPQKTRYQWNADDQLVQVDLPNGERWRYRYDAFGRRLSKECEQGAQSEREIQYRYDGAQVVQQILKAANGRYKRLSIYTNRGLFVRSHRSIPTMYTRASSFIMWLLTKREPPASSVLKRGI